MKIRARMNEFDKAMVEFYAHIKGWGESLMCTVHVDHFNHRELKALSDADADGGMVEFTLELKTK